MGFGRRDQKHLERHAIDSSVPVPYLDREHPDNHRAQWLTKIEHAVDPTVIHETYHALVFKHKANPRQVQKVLLAYTGSTLFLPQTLQTTELGLRVAVAHQIGGRDSLIIANYLSSSEASTVLTLDEDLLRIGQVKSGRRNLTNPKNSKT